MVFSSSRSLGSILRVSAVIAGLLVPAFAASAPVDSDGDGVPDASDACPKEPGLKGADPKTSGCAVKLDPADAKSSADVTFTGYQTLPGGGGILFVEMTDAVAVEVQRTGRRVEYRLIGARVPLRNNKNPLLLKDFDSSAISARLVSDKAKRGARGKAQPQAVRLIVTLRSELTPAHRIVSRGKGAALEIELPAASAASTAGD